MMECYLYTKRDHTFSSKNRQNEETPDKHEVCIAVCLHSPTSQYFRWMKEKIKTTEMFKSGYRPIPYQATNALQLVWLNSSSGDLNSGLLPSKCECSGFILQTRSKKQ